MQQRRWASSGGNSTYLLCHRHNLHPFSSFPYSLTGGDCNFPCKWDCCDERLDVDHLDGGSDGLGASDLVWIILPWTWCLQLDRRLRCKTWVRLAAGEWSQAPYFFILIFFMSRTLHPHLLHLRLPFPLELSRNPSASMTLQWNRLPLVTNQIQLTPILQNQLWSIWSLALLIWVLMMITLMRFWWMY